MVHVHILYCHIVPWTGSLKTFVFYPYMYTSLNTDLEVWQQCIQFSMGIYMQCLSFFACLHVRANTWSSIGQTWQSETNFSVHICSHSCSPTGYMGHPLSMRWMGVCSLYLTVPTSNHELLAGVSSTHYVPYIHKRSVLVLVLCYLITGFLALRDIFTYLKGRAYEILTLFQLLVALATCAALAVGLNATNDIMQYDVILAAVIFSNQHWTLMLNR